jgi:hypothetical protein
VQKDAEKEVKIQEVRYRDTTNVEPEMYDYTSYNWSHWNSNEKLKETSKSYTRKTFDTGIATKSSRKHLEAIPGKHSTDSL